jgi:hypothetical protein
MIFNTTTYKQLLEFLFLTQVWVCEDIVVDYHEKFCEGSLK